MPVRATAQEIIDAALSELGLPTATIGSAQEGQLQIQARALLNRLGDDAVKVHDWQFLLKTANFVGDGVNSTFPFPTADFGRTVNQTEWALNNKRPMIGPLSPQQWGWTQYGIVSVGVYFRYRINNNELEIFPVPGALEQFALYYVSKNWVMDEFGVSKDKITSGSDVPMFDRGLMIAGLKLRLWAIKGFDTTQLAGEYNYRLQAEMGQDQGAAVLNLGSNDGFHYIDTANIPDGSWGV